MLPPAPPPAPRPDEPAAPRDPFEAIAAMVSGAAKQLTAVAAPPEVLAAIRPLPELIRRAATVLRERADAGAPVLPERLTAWQHGLRERATMVVGWVELYRVARDEAKRGRAGERLVRSAAALRAFLGTPPT
jgi:hypothetical protein